MVVESGVVVEVVVVDFGLVVDEAVEAGTWVDGDGFGTALDGGSAPPLESSTPFSCFVASSLLPWFFLA